MKLSTKALLSSLVAAAIHATPSKYPLVPQRHLERYGQLLRKHDRKGELRSAVLGITPQEFKASERRYSLSRIVRLHGFSDEKAFYRALTGKIHDELHRRGWTQQRIERFEMGRLLRVS